MQAGEHELGVKPARDRRPPLSSSFGGDSRIVSSIPKRGAHVSVSSRGEGSCREERFERVEVGFRDLLYGLERASVR